MAISEDGRIVKYKSGGSGALHQMTYAEYLFACNEIFLTLLALLDVELILNRQLSILRSDC